MRAKVGLEMTVGEKNSQGIRRKRGKKLEGFPRPRAGRARNVSIAIEVIQYNTASLAIVNLCVLLSSRS